MIQATGLLPLLLSLGEQGLPLDIFPGAFRGIWIVVTGVTWFDGECSSNFDWVRCVDI